MAATVVLLIMLLAPPATAGAAQAPAAAPCQSFSRSSPEPPPLAHAWLAHSSDARVVVCPKGAAGASEAGSALYFGEGPVTQHGEVCSYLSHGLTLVGSGPSARLERYEHSEALDMALASGRTCPTPHTTAGTTPYVETYDVGANAFPGIMRLWAATAASVAGADPPAAGAARIAPEARARLEAAITAERMRAATVTRIVRIPGSVLRQRYALFLMVPAAPAAGAAQYVVYLERSLRGHYEITAFAETN
ncbi:MAG: hypothetical protein JO274_09360 [Gammaproteobacteria bacterium]|nr:hypothetical protein [Gammaproteobacteria bacterium]